MKLHLGTAQTHSKRSGLILQPCTPVCSPQPRQITGINSTAGRPAFSLSDIFTYFSCTMLRMLHKAVPWPRYTLRWQELLRTRHGTPDSCGCLLPWAQHCPGSATALQLTSMAVFLTSQKPSLHHLPLWLSWNILYILWFVPNAAPGRLILPLQIRRVIPAQREMHGLPVKRNISILKLLWWVGKRRINRISAFITSQLFSVRAADVSDDPRTAYQPLQNTSQRYMEDVLLTLVQPNSKIHSQQAGKAKSDTFTFHLKPLITEAYSHQLRSAFIFSSSAKLFRLIFHNDAISLLHIEVDLCFGFL